MDNSISALDQWYFGNLPSVRQALTHRTCLRVSMDPLQHTLTITDLGIGMTRADLINLLGVGRPMANTPRQRKTKQKQRIASRSTSSSTISSEDDEDDYEDDTDDEEEEGQVQQAAAAAEAAAEDPQQPLLRCKTNDIGGFYAAVCALAVGVKVSTKVRKQKATQFNFLSLLCHVSSYSCSLLLLTISPNLMTITSFKSEIAAANHHRLPLWMLGINLSFPVPWTKGSSPASRRA
jgi:hypothetical protein